MFFSEGEGGVWTLIVSLKIDKCVREKFSFRSFVRHLVASRCFQNSKIELGTIESVNTSYDLVIFGLSRKSLVKGKTRHFLYWSVKFISAVLLVKETSCDVYLIKKSSIAIHLFIQGRRNQSKTLFSPFVLCRWRNVVLNTSHAFFVLKVWYINNTR